MSKKFKKHGGHGGGHHSASNDSQQQNHGEWGRREFDEQRSHGSGHGSGGHGRGIEGWVDGLLRGWKNKLRGIFGHRR